MIKLHADRTKNGQPFDMPWKLLLFLLIFPAVSCRFVKVETSWRKAQDRLSGEEEYDALDKLDRLEVFQEYIRCELGGLESFIYGCQCSNRLNS